jgi:hypothetical protein
LTVNCSDQSRSSALRLGGIAYLLDNSAYGLSHRSLMLKN